MAEQDHQSATAASGSRKLRTQDYYRSVSAIADNDMRSTMPNKENTSALEGYGTGIEKIEAMIYYLFCHFTLFSTTYFLTRSLILFCAYAILHSSYGDRFCNPLPI